MLGTTSPVFNAMLPALVVLSPLHPASPLDQMSQHLLHLHLRKNGPGNVNVGITEMRRAEMETTKIMMKNLNLRKEVGHPKLLTRLALVAMAPQSPSPSPQDRVLARAQNQLQGTVGVDAFEINGHY
jgi:hypothetical protein